MSSVVDVMGFNVLRASVGCIHPGAATSAIIKVGPFNFDYFCFIGHGRRFVDFERRPGDS